MASFIESLRSSLGDGFMALPLLIMGFLFFFGTLTSNVGILYLLLGHFILVPLLGYFTNGIPLQQTTEDQYGSRIATWASYFFFVFFVGGGISNVSNSTNGWYTLIPMILFPLIAIKNGNSFADGFNPMRLFYGRSQGGGGSPECSYIPQKDKLDVVWNEPSLWVIHLLFLAGFLLGNAGAIYNLKAPTLQGADDEEKADRQARLDQRVSNRKRITVGIMISTLIVISILLFFRYTKTPCEGNFLGNIVPLGFCAGIGSLYYYFIEKNCNIYPPDILGIVSGLISPDLIDNPIVCVGS